MREPTTALGWAQLFDVQKRGEVQLKRAHAKAGVSTHLWQHWLVVTKLAEAAAKDATPARAICLAVDLCLELLPLSQTDWEEKVHCTFIICTKLVSGFDSDCADAKHIKTSKELKTWSLLNFDINRMTAHDVLAHVHELCPFTMFETKLVKHLLLDIVQSSNYVNYDPCYVGLAIAVFILLNTRAEKALAFPKKYIDRTQLENHIKFVIDTASNVPEEYFCKSLCKLTKNIDMK
jgi:hypothetical protein